MKTYAVLHARIIDMGAKPRPGPSSTEPGFTTKIMTAIPTLTTAVKGIEGGVGIGNGSGSGSATETVTEPTGIITATGIATEIGTEKRAGTMIGSEGLQETEIAIGIENGTAKGIETGRGIVIASSSDMETGRGTHTDLTRSGAPAVTLMWTGGAESTWKTSTSANSGRSSPGNVIGTGIAQETGTVHGRNGGAWRARPYRSRGLAGGSILIRLGRHEVI